MMFSHNEAKIAGDGCLNFGKGYCCTILDCKSYYDVI